MLGALIATPVAVYASHQFVDVPESHTFHNSIDWLRENSITVGCNPPANDRYCPEENVTRGQMSAFMKRLAENQVVDASTLRGMPAPAFQVNVATDQTTGASFADPAATLAEVTIDAHSDGLVYLEYHVRIDSASFPEMWVEEGVSACGAGSSNPNVVPGTVIGFPADAGMHVKSTVVQVTTGTRDYRVCGSDTVGTTTTDYAGLTTFFVPDLAG